MAVIALASPLACAQWSTDPALNNPVADGPTDQVLPKIAASPDGGCFISWFQNESGNYNVYMQRLNSSGVEQWPHGGVLVSNRPSLSSLVDYDLTADSAGNAVVVFTDARSGTDRDIHAYRVSAAGTPMWGPDGVTLSDDAIFEADPRVVQNSSGDFVFVWPRLNGTAGGSGLVMQVLNPAGEKQLGVSGILLLTGGAPNDNPAFCEMVAADDGSVIVSWVKDTRTFQSQRYVISQKYNASGFSQWNAVAPVTISSAVVVPIAHRPKLVYDGAGGAVYTWHDTRNSNRFDAWVQHVNAAGVIQFPANGLQVSTDSSMHHLDPAVAYNPGTSEIFVAWNERNSAQSQWGIYAQKIDATGFREWGSFGRALLQVDTINKLFPRILTSGAGAMVFCLEQPNSPLPGDRVLGMSVDANGDFNWPVAPVVVSSTISTKGRLPVARLSDGAALIAWEDNRAGTVDVLAQRVNADGTLGGPPCPGDWNQDGGVNSQDFFDFLAAFFAGNADFNNSGTTDSQDFFDFVAAFFTGCP
ncbi:MAG: hypothetical protein H7210_13650 [Pyrinomonadaceae bacterium]|nr:hypothetical protein [Phycisphaerales bacterium]